MDALIEAVTLDRNTPGAAESRERLRAMPRAWREEVAQLDQAAVASQDRRSAALLHLRVAQLHAAYDPEGIPRVVERVERAFALAPGIAAALEILERVFAERGDHRGHADALARLSAQTRDRSGQVAVLLELSRVHVVWFGDSAAALASLQRALALDPSSEVAALQAFELQVDAGQFAEALDALERHLAAAPEKPGHASLRTYAAQLARDRLADPARARRHLEAALRSDPGYAPAAGPWLRCSPRRGSGSASPRRSTTRPAGSGTRWSGSGFSSGWRRFSRTSSPAPGTPCARWRGRWRWTRDGLRSERPWRGRPPAPTHSWS